MPLAGSGGEIVKSLEWAVEEMSFLLCNFLVRLLYHPQSSYPSSKLNNVKKKIKQISSETTADKVSGFISDPLLTSDLFSQDQYRKVFIDL